MEKELTRLSDFSKFVHSFIDSFIFHSLIHASYINKCLLCFYLLWQALWTKQLIRCGFSLWGKLKLGIKENDFLKSKIRDQENSAPSLWEEAWEGDPGGDFFFRLTVFELTLYYRCFSQR